MKKLISSILVVSMLVCSFGISACFAAGSSEEVQRSETKAAQIVNKKVKVVELSKDDLEKIVKMSESQNRENSESKIPNSDKSDNISANRQLARDMVKGAWKGFKITAEIGAVLGAFGGFFAGIGTAAAIDGVALSQALASGLLCVLPGAAVGSLCTLVIFGWIPLVAGALFEI